MTKRAKDRAYVKELKLWLKERRFNSDYSFADYAKVSKEVMKNVLDENSRLYAPINIDELTSVQKTLKKAMVQFDKRYPDAKVELSEFAQRMAEWLRKHDRKLTWLAQQAGLPKHKLHQYTSYSAVREVPVEMQHAVQKVMDEYGRKNTIRQPNTALYEYKVMPVPNRSRLMPDIENTCREMDEDGWEVISAFCTPCSISPILLCRKLKQHHEQKES